MKANVKPLLTLTAADIMSDNVVMLPQEMSLQGAARLLARVRVTGAPVVDDHGHCIGVLSATDFMHWVEKDDDPMKSASIHESVCKPWEIPEGTIPTCTVSDFMTRDPVLVAPGTRIGELATMMIDAHIHRVIVVDAASGRPVGIVSTMDILAAIARADHVPMQDEECEGAMAGPHRTSPSFSVLSHGDREFQGEGQS